MFDNNVPEQIIKEVTGHKSDCVRLYKCTSEVLREQASHTVSNVKQESKKLKVEVESVVLGNEEEEGVTSVKQMIENVNKTKAEIRRHKFLKAKSRLSLNKFRSRSKVTIDLNVNVTK